MPEDFKPKLPGSPLNNVDISKIDKTELSEGMRVEKEHTSDPKLQEEIALAHLNESKDYYDKLKIMEDTSKKDMLKCKKATPDAVGPVGLADIGNSPDNAINPTSESANLVGGVGYSIPNQDKNKDIEDYAPNPDSEDTDIPGGLRTNTPDNSPKLISSGWSALIGPSQRDANMLDAMYDDFLDSVGIQLDTFKRCGASRQAALKGLSHIYSQLLEYRPWVSNILNKFLDRKFDSVPNPEANVRKAAVTAVSLFKEFGYKDTVKDDVANELQYMSSLDSSGISEAVELGYDAVFGPRLATFAGIKSGIQITYVKNFNNSGYITNISSDTPNYKVAHVAWSDVPDQNAFLAKNLIASICPNKSETHSVRVAFIFRQADGVNYLTQADSTGTRKLVKIDNLTGMSSPDKITTKDGQVAEKINEQQ